MRAGIACRVALTAAVAAACVAGGATTAASAETTGEAAGVYDVYLAPPGACPEADLPGAAIADQVNEMLCLINYARSKKGVPTVATSPLLASSTRIKADDIVRCDDFSHTACGHSVTYPFERAGYIAPGYDWGVGENLAWGTGTYGTPRGAMRGWLYSDPHRENIFTPSWREQGVALQRPQTFQGYTDNSVWVSHFGWRRPIGGGQATAARTAGRLSVSVRPRRVIVGRRVRFVFRARLVTASGERRPLGGVRILFAGRRTRTRATGRAKLVVRLRHARRYRVRARKPGLGRVRASVRAQR